MRAQAVFAEADHKVLEILDGIFDAMSDRGLSQAELARLAGITPESLSRLKRSGRADFRTVYRLAEVVGFEIMARPKDDYATQLERGLF